MKSTKQISKQKPINSDPKLLAEQKTLNLMIAKNPNLKNLIDKFNLVLTKNS
jgi:hypothetical protein